MRSALSIATSVFASAVLAGGSIVLTAGGAHADDTMVINGSNYPGTDDNGIYQGPDLVFVDCTDPLTRGSDSEPIRLRLIYSTDDPPIGLHAHGFDLSGGSAIGPMAYTATPTTSVWSMRVTPDMAGTTRGFALAWYVSDAGEWYKGIAPVLANNSGWRTVDAQAMTLNWTRFDEMGAPVGGAGSGTLPAFAASRGGDGSGAFLGFAFGCEGERFFYDGLRVGAPGSVTTHDFEGVQPEALMLTGDKTVRAGSKVRLLGVPDAAHGSYQQLEMVLEAKSFGTDEFTEVARAVSTYDSSTGQQVPAEVTVKPQRRTEYRWVIEESSSSHRSVSPVSTVEVKTAVTMSVIDAQVEKGDKLKVTGSTRPHKSRVAVELQRLVSGEWKRLTKRATRTDGSYALSTTADRRGTWRLRVLVHAASGNLEGVSPVRKATVS